MLIKWVGNILRTDSNVTALVAAVNISYGLRPQQFDTLPAINFFEIAETVRDNMMGGTHSVQISARAVKLDDAVSVSEACSRALYRFDPRTAQSVDVQRVWHGGRVTMPEPEIDAYHVALTMRFAVLSTVA